ncbi:MAG: type II toxin-antitoxin system mRNA interferase toxin, RelE/StbE family [Proteobacteria bacterium]|nr:type II toxin-antitoxin system mRNA interferase toxin, RelE/StbE family [Pseudomonadota bacterium]
MIKITWDEGFKKIYKKKVSNNQDLKKKFWDTLKLFTKNPFNQKLKTHKLRGKLEGLWALSITYDCRLIFKFIKKDEVLLIDIGGHDEVY